MKSLLILLTPAAPACSYPCWYTLWCMPHATSCRPSVVDDVYRLPAAPVSHLCQVLLAVQRFPPLTAVAISTTGAPPSPVVDDIRAAANLTGEDTGTLWFLRSEQLVRCAQDAIRCRNPEAGAATLNDLWQQALLAGLADDV